MFVDVNIMKSKTCYLKLVTWNFLEDGAVRLDQAEQRAGQGDVNLAEQDRAEPQLQLQPVSQSAKMSLDEEGKSNRAELQPADQSAKLSLDEEKGQAEQITLDVIKRIDSPILKIGLSQGMLIFQLKILLSKY